MPLWQNLPVEEKNHHALLQPNQSRKAAEPSPLPT